MIQWSQHPLHGPEGRDMIQLSQHQIQRVKVATSKSGRDTRSKKKQVATSLSYHDINCEEIRSRRQSAVMTSDNRKEVATSDTSKEGRDIIELSRKQLPEIMTTSHDQTKTMQYN